MIKNSKEWATSRDLVRRNEVHGAEEWRIPTASLYEFNESKKHEHTSAATFEIEDPEGTILDSSGFSAENTILYRG